MKTKVFTTIKEIIDRKIKNKIEPVLVTLRELREATGYSNLELKKPLNELISEGKIDYGFTINDVYFKLK